MYDTIYMRLTQAEVQEDFMGVTASYLTDVAEHTYGDSVVLTGKVGNLSVSLNRWQVKIKDGSLSKYYLGDNLQTLSRAATEQAIAQLSDTLHLHLDRAICTRIDVAENFICRFAPEVYFCHLGQLTYSTRLQEPNGIYYKQTGGRLAFYDKVKECRSRREELPELYQAKNVLRYEMRLAQRIAHQMGVPEVTVAKLYDEAFYMAVIDRWQANYKKINKLNDITLNFQAMKTKQQLYKMGVLSLIERAGGQLQILDQIKEAQTKGELTKKQAYDLRLAINAAAKAKEGFTTPNEAIQELDKKVKEAALFYR